MKKTPDVVDVDWYVDDPRPERVIRVERDKALAAGVDPDRALRDVTASVAGTVAGLLHDERAREDAPIVVRLPLSRRADARDLDGITVRGTGGRMGYVDFLPSPEREDFLIRIFRRLAAIVTERLGSANARKARILQAIRERREALREVVARENAAIKTLRRELEALNTEDDEAVLRQLLDRRY